MLLRSLTRFVCLLALAAALPGGAWAQDQRAFLSLTVNGVAQDEEALVLLRGDDVLIAVTALESSGLRGFDGRRESAGETMFVSLSSLAPRVTFRLDEVSLALAITADPSLLGEVVRSFHTGAPADLQYRSAPSAFVNYSVSTGTGTSYDLFTETGVSARGALLTTTVSRGTQGFVRGLSSLTLDDRIRIRRWVAGDSFATAGALGGDALVAGITVSREFSVAPYYVRYPTMSMSTAVEKPSTLEVHVNGRLVREEQVQPGRLDLRQLPLSTGHNETRLVIRDPFGGTREVSGDFYFTSSVLGPGIHEYQYSFGWQRESLGRDSWDYRKPVALARHRVGLSDAVTGGVRLEATRGLVSGGPSLNLRLPAGEVEAAWGVSRTAGGWGTAAQLSYAYAARRFSVGSLATYTGTRYAHLSLSADRERGAGVISAYASLPLPGSSLTVQHARTLGPAPVAQTRTSAQGSARLSRRAEIVGNLTRVADVTGRDTQISVGLSMTFGPRTTSSVSLQRTASGTQVLTDVQRPLPVGTGYGYQFRTESGQRTGVSGSAQYQGSYGRYEVRNDVTGGTPRTSVSASGGLVAIGGGLHPSRAIRESYALVRVPDVPGVRAFSSNQEIGRTSSRGTLLVPDLLAYYGNRLAIADADVPIDYEVSAVQMTLAPPYRGGAVAEFPVQRIQRIVGTIRLLTADGAQIPNFGSLEVTVGDRAVSSPLGGNGEFYLENLRPGVYQARVTHGLGGCTMEMRIPKEDGAVVTLGELSCRAKAGR